MNVAVNQQTLHQMSHREKFETFLHLHLLDEEWQEFCDQYLYSNFRNRCFADLNEKQQGQVMLDFLDYHRLNKHYQIWHDSLTC